MAEFARRQRAVLAGMAAGLAWTGAVLLLGPVLLRPAGAPLEVAAAALLLPALTLVAAVGRIAAARFLDAAIIDGQDAAPGSPTDLAQRVLRNTLEQCVLAALVWPALAVSLPPDRLGVIPALGFGFLVARIAFAAGYSRGAGARSFGFAATFYPTVAAALWALALAVGR